MKVIFLIKSDYTPSSRIRVNDLIPFLKERGIDVVVEILPKSSGKRKELLKNVSIYDIVVLQKRLLKFWDFRLLRKNSKKLIFDFDDAIYLRSAAPSQEYKDYVSSTRKRLFNRIVKNVDLTIAANNILAKKVCEISKEAAVKVIPSTISMDNITYKKNVDLSDQIVIGWIGTQSTLRYLDLVADSLVLLAESHNIILRVVADQSPVLSGVKVDFVKWSLDNQYNEISKFDIGIMPLTFDPFSEGKSSFKLLQYLAVGVPSVCSPVGMNIDVACDGKYALVAQSANQFYNKIVDLIEHKELREKLSTNGQCLIKDCYSNKSAGEQLADVLFELHNQ